MTNDNVRHDECREGELQIEREQNGVWPSPGQQRQSWKAAGRKSLSSNKVKKEQELVRQSGGVRGRLPNRGPACRRPAGVREREARARREAPGVRSAHNRSNSEIGGCPLDCRELCGRDLKNTQEGNG